MMSLIWKHYSSSSYCISFSKLTYAFIVVCLFSLQVFDNYSVTVMIGCEPYTLGLFDTSGRASSTLIQLFQLSILYYSQVLINFKRKNKHSHTEKENILWKSDKNKEVMKF